MRANIAVSFSLLLFATAYAGTASAGEEQPIFLDGFETGCAQLVGLACDGNDSDLCPTGVIACVSDSPVCSDDATSTLDVCNNLDDDCDVASADGSEDPQLGQMCDGNDSDLCPTGTVTGCAAGSRVCNDDAASTLDLCNGNDDDCDAGSADGSEDSLIGGQCDGGDTDMCPEGLQQCVTGAPVCSDTSGNNVEVCNGNDDDCDTQVDEGTRDTNPVCDTETSLGSVSGDSGNQLLQASGLEERWYRFRMTENDFSISGIYLSATLTLTSPQGADFDLFVYCLSCGGTLAGSSTTSNLTGHFDIVNVRANDEVVFGEVDDSIDLLVEIRYKSGPSCSFWNLAVSGNTTVNSVTCP